ncbi:DUF4263 domain-containing protein [Streptomyces phaeoluteigriseus]|uniref:DUF4263 domain-containing protein n=1 Tax=Streptomyces phaeoluteigriseus TaxID=114686 RepID=A0ABY4ZKV1_9ACTN|nr:Shedu anti-phage system protein SduA domain-containing protein [Streptomyces phaeoluteigriseus]USQ89621.1 DUF4263 domain-containing protein [Streptomyces phaeoluteigriseus]
MFGYGLNLIACESIDYGKLERITTGANIFGGAGKRIDAIMRSKGLISSMLFGEIKTHDTELLAKTPYRAGVYQASKELGGGLAQVQKTASKAQQLISREFLTRIYDDGTPTSVEMSTTRPRQVVVIGSLRESTRRPRKFCTARCRSRDQAMRRRGLLPGGPIPTLPRPLSSDTEPG